MRIAQVAPLFERVPPRCYGGTERVVSYLTEELVRQGHKVTLFASGDSTTSAELVSTCARSLRLDPDCRDPIAPHLVMLEEVVKQAHRFDIIHFHVDYLHYPISEHQSYLHVTTLHGRLDLRELPPLYREFARVPVISISNAQREPLPWLNWQGTIYHGLPPDLYAYCGQSGKYLAFLGRASPEKGMRQAIEIAKLTGIPLKIAAKIDRADQDYYDQVVAPFLQDPLIEFLGEIGGKAKEQFLGEAMAVLFPITWPEPFGLVMIEAMSCGTPVIAFRNGSVPEVMEDGVTGFVVDNQEQAAQAVRRVAGLNRAKCRQAFEARFTAGRMAQDYLRIYRAMLMKQRNKHSGATAQGDTAALSMLALPRDGACVSGFGERSLYLASRQR